MDYTGTSDKKISVFNKSRKLNTDKKETDLKIRKAFLYYFIGLKPGKSSGKSGMAFTAYILKMKLKGEPP